MALVYKGKIVLVKVLILTMLLGSCATGHKAGKLPKKGKIPCPVKDC